MRYWSLILSLVIALGLSFVGPSLATVVPCYSTLDSAPVTGVEKGQQVFARPVTLTLAVGTNYDTANPKVLMIFDTASAPTTGAVPRYQLTLLPAVSANQPSQLSLSIPLDGVSFNSGLYVGCSSTGKTFTLDATANCFFNVCTH